VWFERNYRWRSGGSSIPGCFLIRFESGEASMRWREGLRVHRRGCQKDGVLEGLVNHVGNWTGRWKGHGDFIARCNFEI
jgi:hypothetical protein